MFPKCKCFINILKTFIILCSDLYIPIILKYITEQSKNGIAVAPPVQTSIQPWVCEEPLIGDPRIEEEVLIMNYLLTLCNFHPIAVNKSLFQVFEGVVEKYQEDYQNYDYDELSEKMVRIVFSFNFMFIDPPSVYQDIQDTIPASIPKLSYPCRITAHLTNPVLASLSPHLTPIDYQFSPSNLSMRTKKSQNQLCCAEFILPDTIIFTKMVLTYSYSINAHFLIFQQHISTFSI